MVMAPSKRPHKDKYSSLSKKTNGKVEHEEQENYLAKMFSKKLNKDCIVGSKRPSPSCVVRGNMNFFSYASSLIAADALVVSGVVNP